MKLHAIETGLFKLDGGAMFGVVPKVLWEKTNPADSNNRVQITARSLLIEEGNRLILIDTGLGNKQSKKFFSYYDRSGDFFLESSLKKTGFSTDDITDVFLTHLHFDHCGGAVFQKGENNYQPTFKNATYWSHKDHWEWAINPNPREKASFLTENILPIQESGQLKLLEGKNRMMETSPLDFAIFFADGHTEKQMLPIIQYKNKTIIFAADLIPTVGHLPIPYVPGYDVRPLLTLDEKTMLLNQAVEKEHFLFLEHDPYHELISLENTPKGVRKKEAFTLKSYFD